MGKSVTGIRIAIAALLFAPLIAYSAGLGRLTVLSSLGQPLNAEIEIVSLQSGEEDSLTARLGSPEAFRQAGIEFSSALVGVQFSIDKRGERAVIRLRTVQPVNEPFLDLLVELQWATGRLVREYTFLLDPPEYKGPQPIAAAPAPAPAARPSPEPAPARPAPRIETRPLAAAPAAVVGKHEVKKGDTLGAIARKNKPEGVTLNQMLIALYRANQAAFIRGNINLVRAGRILSIPDRDAIAGVDTVDANRLVQSQMADFAEYRRKLAAAVAAAPAAPAVREREVAGRITAKPEAIAPAEPKDQLKLSKADPAKPGAPAARAAREDDRAARDRALKDAKARVGDLEKNVADLQKLVEMKNQQLAELEKKAAAKPAPAAPAAPAPVAKAPEPAKPAAEPAKPVAAAPKEAPKETAKEAPKEAPKDAAKEAPKPKPKAAPAKPAPQTDMVDDVIAFVTDPVSGGGLGVVILLLIGYGALAWRRKKASQTTKFQDSVLGAASGPGGAAVFEAAAQPAAAAAVAAAAPDLSQVSVSGPSVGAAESDEVDPIAEADVYMAYGRDAQAEEILKEALGKDPNRVAVHAKLLEIYANRRDAKSFEQSALKLKGLTNSAGPEWDKAMALGHSIDPGNGLYGSGGAAAAPAEAPAAAAPALDFDIGGGAEPAGQGAAAKAGAGLDFDIGAAAPAAEQKSDFAAGGTLIIDSKEVKAASSSLDFDLGGGDEGEKTMLLTPQKPAPAATADPDATVAMDFDLNIDLGGPKAETAKPAAEAPLDLGGLSLDLGGSGDATPAAGSADPKWQEVATKLDLAKAYQEMGDKDGARELLNEVVKEGDAAQQSQAQQMLSNLG